MTISRELQKGGLINGTILGNVTTSNIYSDFAELGNYNAQYNTADIYNVTYTRDKLGRIISKAETINATSSTYEYDYDLAGRLVEEKTDSVVTNTWDYDLNGNRTHVNGVLIATYDDQDRLLTYDGNSYTYTDNGELLTKTNGVDVTSYDYDVLGNLLSVTQPDGTLIEYLIDPRGRRVGKKVDGVLIKGWLYKDKLNPIAELDATGNIISRFIYADRSNIPSYMVKAGVTYRIITNQLGSPLKIVDIATGAVIQEMSYDVWGNVLADSNPDFQPFAFAGGIYDSDTQLTRFGFRDYDAGSARWTSKDPIKFNGGDTNLFGYILNDPINFVDESGLITPQVIAGLVYGIGSVILTITFDDNYSAGDLLVSFFTGFAAGFLPVYNNLKNVPINNFREFLTAAGNVQASALEAIAGFFPTIAESLINTGFAEEIKEEYLIPGEVSIICTIGGDCNVYPILEPKSCP